MARYFDLYVWVRDGDRRSVIARFIEHYVDAADPGDPRFGAFVRTFVEGAPQEGDPEALLELRRDPDVNHAFSLYLHAKHHDEAIITVTEEGDVVLGIGLDDPNNSREVWERASTLLTVMCAEFAALGGIGGVELAPPQSAAEWSDDGLVQLRQGAGP